MSEQVSLEQVDKSANPISSALQSADKLGEWMAKSGMYGVKTIEQGKVLAMTCVVDKITPMEFNQTYHVIDGKPTMRADAMVARFCRNSGDYEIKKWTNDECEIEFQWKRNGKDKKFVYAFTMSDAQRAKLVKSGSAWEKTPKQMLFARCVSMGLRACVPELFAGCYLADEIRDDVTPERAVESAPLLVDTAKKADAPKPATIDGVIVSENAVDTPANSEVEPRESDEGAGDGDEKLSSVLKKHKVKLSNAVGLLLTTGWVTEEDIKGVPAKAVIDGLDAAKKQRILASIDGFAKRCEAM